jgi:chemotaxis protein MotB
MKDDTPVRTVIQKPRPRRGHHGGAWKVAYADFVTTMMALFIVLWLVGQNEAVKQAIAEYFRNPGIFRETRSTAPLPEGAGVLPGGRAAEAAAPPPEKPGDAEERALAAAGERVKGLLERSGLLEGVRDQIRIELTPEGLRIELMERDNSLFFRVGSATVIEPMKTILEKVYAAIAPLPNAITVEGHTDSRQYSQWRNYSNWELSTDRANSARRVLEGAGMPPGRIDRVVGHADLALRIPDDPLDAGNRRISILIRRHGAPTPPRG